MLKRGRSLQKSFSLSEVSTLEVPDIQMKFVWKETTRKPPFWTVIGSQVVWRHSVRLEIGEQKKNLQLTLFTSQDQQNVFFQVIIHFTILTAIIFEVWSMFGAK